MSHEGKEDPGPLAVVHSANSVRQLSPQHPRHTSHTHSCAPSTPSGIGLVRPDSPSLRNNGQVTEPLFLEGLGALGAAGLSWDFCVAAGTIPLVTEAAKANPTMTLILDHFGHGGSVASDYDRSVWSADMAALAESCPNVYVKVGSMFADDETACAPRRTFTARVLPKQQTGSLAALKQGELLRRDHRAVRVRSAAGGEQLVRRLLRHESLPCAIYPTAGGLRARWRDGRGEGDGVLRQCAEGLQIGGGTACGQDVN